jgi:Acetyltransferase (GNAT) domain
MSGEPLTLREVQPGDWHRLSAGFRDLTFEQTRAYCEPAAARVGAKPRFIAVERAGTVVALAAMRVKKIPLLGRGIVWLPAGPMILAPGEADPSPAELTAILAALRHRLVETEGHVLQLRFSALSFLEQARAQQIAREAGFGPATRTSVYKTYALGTRFGEEELMRKLNGKWRGNLRNALKVGLTIDRAADDRLNGRFDEVFQSVQLAKGFVPSITTEFHRSCKAEDYGLETFVVSKDGVDLGAGMLVVTGQNANYLFGATNEAGRPVRAGYQLTWAMIQRCVELGLTWMDLGGVDFEANPDVAGYKERIGADYVEGAGPFEASPAGMLPKIIHVLEDLRARRKSRSSH